MRPSGTYRARGAPGSDLRDFPAVACERCGYVRPDAERVKEMPPDEVPLSVRLRCP